MEHYLAPKLGRNSFHCPHCGIFSHQTWSEEIACFYFEKQADDSMKKTYYMLGNASIAKCNCCEKFSIWIDGKVVYPLTGNVELANPNLPEDILQDYNEARNIVTISPRGAAALLRLAIQKMCKHIGEQGKNLNDDIGNLVKKGLPKKFQEALDSLRVIGNNAVHPGVFDLNDKFETAFALFGLVNVLCEYFISQPKRIHEIYDKLPQKDKENIDKRDS